MQRLGHARDHDQGGLLDRRDDDHRRNPEHHAGCREQPRPESHGARHLAGPGGLLRPGTAQEPDPHRFDEGGGGEPTGQRQRGHRDRHGDGDAGARHRQAVEQALEQQPFADEPVQRWQGGDGQRPHHEYRRRDRHSPHQPAQPVEVAGARRHLDRTGGQKQAALERGVVHQHEQGGHHRQRGERGTPLGSEQP